MYRVSMTKDAWSYMWTNIHAHPCALGSICSCLHCWYFNMIFWLYSNQIPCPYNIHWRSFVSLELYDKLRTCDRWLNILRTVMLWRDYYFSFLNTHVIILLLQKMKFYLKLIFLLRSNSLFWQDLLTSSPTYFL